MIASACKQIINLKIINQFVMIAQLSLQMRRAERKEIEKRLAKN